MSSFISFLSFESKKGKNAYTYNREEGKGDYFAALVSPLIPDENDVSIKARTITIKNARDAQVIITDVNNTESADDAFDRILLFLGSRFDPAWAGKDIIALDPLIERIFIRRKNAEPLQYPVHDTTGKPVQTAVMKKNPMLVVRKGLRTASSVDGNNDRLYIPIRASMPKDKKDALVNRLYRHKAVKIFTKRGVLKKIGINPDIVLLIDAVMPHLVYGYPPLSSSDWETEYSKNKGAERIYVWLEVNDRKYYNKIITQIYEIIDDFYASELKEHTAEDMYQLEIQPAVFVTKSGIGGEICSLIPFIGSGYVFPSDDNYVTTNMKKISSMDIELKNNEDM